MSNNECIEKLNWVLDDLLRLQESCKHVHIGAINNQNLVRMITDVDRVKTELENRQQEES